MVIFDTNKIFGKDKKQENPKDESFKKLEEFSEDLMDLAREIEERLEEKRALEERMDEKNRLIGRLRVELFELKEKLMKTNLELTKLEQRREGVEKTNGNQQDAGE